MNISWVLADQLTIDPTINIGSMKQVGPLWGSWRTWRGCSTDNVICHDMAKADDLVKRSFQLGCNFYIPNDVYQKINRPDGVRLYEGSFLDEFQPEEIVAMHLAAANSDIVLLLGFDWTEKPKNPDRLLAHRALVYRNLVSGAIKTNPQTQWVLVDHPGEIDPELAKLENLTKDTMDTALSLLNA